jgi:protein TonB
MIDYSDAEQPNPQSASPETRSCGANIIVLSADPVLIELLRDSLAGTHRVWRADDARHAADLVLAAGNSVLLLDASLADQNTYELVTRIHQQFPDLAIIVAGRRDDEAALAELISQGIVFRFLHKPASADRIRNFVDATQRRRQQDSELAAPVRRQTAAPALSLAKLALPWSRIDRARARRYFRRSLLLILLAAIVLLIVAWEPWRYLEDLLPEGDSAPVAPVDAGQDAAVLRLLDAAGLALSQGHLVNPPDRNALELYRAVFARDPDNRMARQGIARIADELLVQAEQALTDQDLPRLASAVDAARSARPDHPRLQFFTTQLERERERQADASQPLRAAGSAVGEALNSSAARSTAGRVQGLVLLANQRMRSNRLVGGKDSAHAYLLAARRLDPADAGMQQGIAALAALLQSNARRAIDQGRLDEAGDWVHNAVILDINRAQVAALRSELEAARLGNQRADRERLLVLANQRIAQGRLVEPVADSARHYLDLLRAADPAHEGLSETSALLATRALAEARRLAAADADTADRLLKAAADAGAPQSELAPVAAAIAAARSAPPEVAPASTVLPENALRRVRFVPPQYPARALDRGITGWVDIEFTVATDGTTRDAKVRAAEPAEVFERAALNAVGRWRYEPHQVDGVAVDQRVAARVRFELAE